MPAQRNESLTGVLLLWLMLQCAALVLSALRVPLSAHPPRPVESAALMQMAVVQIAAAALLAPVLFRSISAVLVMALTAAPMLQLAAILSSAPAGKTIGLYLLSASWIACVGAVCVAVAAPRKMLVTAAATGWAVGGLAVAYLRAEFAAGARPVADVIFGPALLAMRLEERWVGSPTLWFFLGTSVSLLIITTWAQLRRNRAQTPA